MALQLSGSNIGLTGSFNTTTEGIYSGSFSGSFVGDGSGLTGIAGGGGTVDTSGTPAAGRLAVFTDSDTIAGYSNLTWNNSFDDSKLTISGYIVPDIIIGEGVISASIFSGSFVGDGSGLTGIPGGGNGEYVPFITGSVSSGILPREGENFTTLGANTTIAGGRLNTGSAPCSFVGGGRSNKVCTNGQYGSVLGGQNNQVHFCHGVVAGGLNNTAVSCASSILGGADNCVQSTYSTVVSGRCNEIKQTSEYSFIGAGLSNTGSASCGFIGGGENNSMTHGGNNAIVGGCNNCVSGSTHSSILGGFNNCVGLSETFTLPCVTDPQPAAFSAIGAGKNNCMLYYYSFIGAGSDNVIDNIYGFIGAGRNNCIKFDTQGLANPSDSFIGSGRYNCVFGEQSVIVGGQQNKAYGGNNGIVGGLCNTTFGLYSFIGAGHNNTISGSSDNYSGIVGGKENHISHSNSFIVGSNISSSIDCTTFMNNGVITGSLTVGCTNRISSTVGRIDATNDIVAFSTSDRRLKENIQPISDALCKVIGVSGNTFDWKPLSKEEAQTIHGNTGRDVGVIAQEIENILPEAVTTRDSGYKAVNYEKIVPLLIEAIKEQQKQIDELKSKV